MANGHQSTELLSQGWTLHSAQHSSKDPTVMALEQQSSRHRQSQTEAHKAGQKVKRLKNPSTLSPYMCPGTFILRNPILPFVESFANLLTRRMLESNVNIGLE
jgi:hypothetical protein